MSQALDRYLTTPPEWDNEPTDDGMCEVDEPTPAAPAYDLDASDAEWHDKPVTSSKMALDVLQSGRALITHCGPLQVWAENGDTRQGVAFTITIWNTVTGADWTDESSDYGDLGDRLTRWASLLDGAWRVHCPDEPDGAPLY